MMDNSKNEMEISKSSSGSSESTMTCSWVLLDSNNTTKDDEGKGDKENMQIACDQSRDAKDNTSDSTNNKSDAESDGISIISESEFFNGSSDEDDSISSSYGNVTDNLKLVDNDNKMPQNIQVLFQEINDLLHDATKESSSDEKEPLESVKTGDKHSSTEGTTSPSENPVEKEEISNIFVDNVPVIDATMTLCDVPEESIESSREPTDNEEKPHDKRFFNWTLKDVFTKFLQFNVLCFAGTILFAFLASCIPSKTNEGNVFSPEKSIQNKPNINSDEFKSQYIYDHCYRIHEKKELDPDVVLERCIEELMTHMIKTKQYKQGKQNIQRKKLISSNRYPKNEESSIFSEYKAEKDLIHTEKRVMDKYEMLQTNKSTEDFRENDSVKRNKQPKRKRYNEDREKQFKQNKRDKEPLKGKKNNSKANEVRKSREEEILNEKEKLKNWKKLLDKREKRLIEWEMKLLKREKKYETKLFNDNSNEKYTSNKKIKIEKYKSRESNNRKKSDKKSRMKMESIKMHQIPLKTPKSVRLSHDRKKNETSAFNDHKISGEWYINLSQSRNEIRRKDDKANWWFDRANLRKIKRDKAYWYFQYMVNREDLRYNHKNF